MLNPACRLGVSAVLSIFCLATAAPSRALDRTRAQAIHQKLFDPDGGIFVVAHRGCHNPVPDHAMPAAPENSLAALEKCVALGVDMMETDIRRAKDGTLVIMHDDTVDRTTDGHGRVADLTLAELKALHLRQNFGGVMSPQTTDQRVLTLDELLAAAKGRIMINLDIKEAIYPEVIAAAVRLGVADEVLVKTVVDEVEPPLTDQAPYSQVPYMPMIWRTSDAAGDQVPAVLAAQFKSRRRSPAVEMDFLTPTQFHEVSDAAKSAHVRVWANTLTSVSALGVVGLGGDEDALRDHGATWGRLIRGGASVIQTDEPEPLMSFLNAKP